VKTDDPATRQRDEVAGDEAKVVRLSDWLAPDDELVPFGPRADAREPAEGRADPDSGAEPSAASGFWDGDTSVHTAVPGPGIFDEPGERTADRRAQVWRPALPPLHPFGWGSRARDRLADLVDRISWRWAAAGVTVVALALVVLVITLGGSSSDRRDTAAQAGIGDPSRAALNETLDEIGTATRAAAVTDLRPLPSVDAAVRSIGVAGVRARALEARRRRHAVVAPASVPSSSTTESVETPATTPAPAPTETTPAPTETEPVQTTSTPTPTTGGGSSSSGGGSSSGSQNQSAFGATGSLGPGSSPNG
jgi:hypothetical protein